MKLSGKPETVRDLHSTDYLTQFDLNDKDVVLEIADVQIDELPIVGTPRKEKRGVLLFKGGKIKKMVLNATNIKTIARMYGGELRDWVGKRITLYRDATIKFGRETVGGIRVRPVKPKALPQKAPTLQDVLDEFEAAGTEEELRQAGELAKGLNDHDKNNAKMVYMHCLEVLRGKQQAGEVEAEPDYSDIGPPPMSDEDIEASEDLA